MHGIGQGFYRSGQWITFEKATQQDESADITDITDMTKVDTTYGRAWIWVEDTSVTASLNKYTTCLFDIMRIDTDFMVMGLVDCPDGSASICAVIHYGMVVDRSSTYWNGENKIDENMIISFIENKK